MAVKRARWLAALALPLALAACGGGSEGAEKTDTALENVAAPADKAWSKTVAMTDEGGFRMGNPDAPLKLVEYASLVCVHCRDFKKESFAELTEMVDSGRLSYEFRTFLLGPHDIAPTVIARCAGGADRFFPLMSAWYDDWDANMAKIMEVTKDEAKLAALNAMTPDKAGAELGRMGGVVDFYAARGVSADQANTCLASKPEMEKLNAISELGTKEGVTGTPTFFLNGKRVDFKGWVPLKNQLRDAGVR